MTTDHDAHWRESQQKGQIAMMGDDWLSDRDKKAQARADKALKAATAKAASSMRRAAVDLRAQYRAYVAAGHPENRGAGDQRLTLSSDLDELASFFEGFYK